MLRCRRMFEEFDADNSGEISTIEMHAVMKATSGLLLIPSSLASELETVTRCRLPPKA